MTASKLRNINERLDKHWINKGTYCIKQTKNRSYTSTKSVNFAQCGLCSCDMFLKHIRKSGKAERTKYNDPNNFND